MSKKIIEPRLAIFAVFALMVCEVTVADTFIASLPYTMSISGETYFLSSNLRYTGNGTALRVTADNVTLDGGGNELEYCVGGLSNNTCTGLSVSGTLGVRIQNITFRQGGQTFSAGGSGAAIRGLSVRNITVTGSTFYLIARPTATEMFGVDVDTTTAGSVLELSNFNITGAGPMKAIDQPSSSPWVVRGNVITITNLKYKKSYARIINVSHGGEYLNNRISVDAGSEYVNLFVSWGKRDGRIVGNTIDYASVHGRPILLDSGSKRWEVADNTIRITSNNIDDNVVYAIRIRGEKNSGSSEHKIHHNTIDTRGSRKTSLISIGGGSLVNVGNEISFNKLIGSFRPIEFYNDVNEGTRFFCNSIEHSGSSNYPIYLYGNQHTDTAFSHNGVTTNRTDDFLVFFGKPQSIPGAWSFCDTIDGFSQISGETYASGSVVIEPTSCSLGYTQCYLEAGARAGSSGGPPSKPNPPLMLGAQ